MAYLLKALIVACALWAPTVAVDCSGGTCEDTTSFMQTKHAVNIGSQRQDEVKALKCHYDKKCARAQVERLTMETIGRRSQWRGVESDWDFMTQYDCDRKDKMRECHKFKADECQGDCQWYPVEHVCRTLKVDAFIEYAKAADDSPFDLYTKGQKSCNGLNKKNCKAKEGHCLWDEDSTWAPCVVGPKLFEELMCTASWQTLLEKVDLCEDADNKDCEALDCELVPKDIDGDLVTKGHSTSADYEGPLDEMKCRISDIDWYTLSLGFAPGTNLYNKLSGGFKPKTCVDEGLMKTCKENSKYMPICAKKPILMKQVDTCTGFDCERGLHLDAHSNCSVAFTLLDKICAWDTAEDEPVKDE